MADMEIAVGFWRETGAKPAAILAGSKVILNFLLYKVKAAFIDNAFFNDLSHIS